MLSVEQREYSERIQISRPFLCSRAHLHFRRFAAKTLAVQPAITASETENARSTPSRKADVSGTNPMRRMITDCTDNWLDTDNNVNNSINLFFSISGGQPAGSEQPCQKRRKTVSAVEHFSWFLVFLHKMEQRANYWFFDNSLCHSWRDPKKLFFEI